MKPVDICKQAADSVAADGDAVLGNLAAVAGIGREDAAAGDGRIEHDVAPADGLDLARVEDRTTAAAEGERCNGAVGHRAGVVDRGGRSRGNGSAADIGGGAELHGVARNVHRAARQIEVGQDIGG